MAKGKKFSAVEKHFEEKCVEWRHKIREVEADRKRMYEKYLEMQKENERLEAENRRLLELNEEIIKLKDMSKADIAVLMAGRRFASAADTMFRHMF